MSIKSGVDLKEKIPSGWKIIPLRWYMSCKSGESIDTNLIEKGNQQEILFPVIGGNGIMGYSNMINTSFKTLSIGRVGALCGNVHYIDYPCWITDNSLLINDYNDNEINLGFLKLVLEQLNLNHYSTSTAQPLITGETIKKRKIALPPMDIQELIVGYVQQSTKNIDRMITFKQNLISLLEEKRQSIISEAVKKGLDSNVKMKNSSIEWIGEIPEHWEVKRVKHFSELVGSGKTPSGGSEVYLDEGIPFLRSLNVHFNGIRLKNLAFISEEIDNEMRSTRIQPLDNLLNITGASIGRSCIVPKDFGPGNVNQHVCVIRVDQNKINPYYFNSIMNSKMAMDQIMTSQTGSSREGLNFQQVKNLMFPVAPLEEQEELNRFIFNKQKEIYSVIYSIELQIQKLKEYRQSLIYEAVTGKIDVREMIAEK